MLKKTKEQYYRRIISTIRLMAPFFDDFELVPSKYNQNYILLNWKERGSHPDLIFGPHQLSDGTLRMMALVTLLLQPELPNLIIIDEPELGLHPYAITVLASLLRSASAKTQIIVSTQSVTLIDQLELDDLIVVDRKDNQSVFKRLASHEFEVWLEEYSLGELWEKNVLGGGLHVVKLNIIVEGHTEETFVRDMLSPHLSMHDVYVGGVRCVETGRKRGKIYRGRITSYRNGP
ncbi:AAA family ATPase [Desulfofarcimen acetoxidans]|uniref:AAA family ATPase n=1 Tax=Desulfofarcimen acetoxidans TaxID=58138 RepID=UPI00019E4D1A|nr:AAA family ATPase [Desulfofarcimen acetoxidans]